MRFFKYVARISPVAILLLVTPLFVQSLQAQTLTFDDGRLLSQQREKAEHYRLVLSELKRIQARTFGETERRLKGQLWRRLWQVDRGVSLAEAEASLLGQLQASQSQSPGQLLYRCQGRDCGSSHFWANRVFANARLVGREQHQRYWVWQQNSTSGKQTIWVFYASQRGSKQILVNLDRLTTTQSLDLASDGLPALAANDAEDAETTAQSSEANLALRQNIERQLQLTSAWLPGLIVGPQQQFDAAASAELLAALQQLPAARQGKVHLVVHCYRDTDMAQNRSCSKAVAEQLQQALTTTKLTVHSGAALTPPPQQTPQQRDDAAINLLHQRLGLRFISWPK